MLRLNNIVKEYKVADTKVLALKGISLAFRKNEFVSILGPSGCGKTTTLNIIGGLDHYTSGDLIINGKSTKKFNDRDWDVYRNHRVGFIFQSYNLIPHQTILQNVELALTIAGINQHDREERAKRALDEVGLKNQYNKKPNQLSGGQCQRVAIARALVNEPEILLADEPTGALDTKTSVQIMDLIKKISKDKLVIMVTHNPDLAKNYSTRIINLLDGEVVDDSNPYSFEEEEKEEFKPAENEKAKMSWWTSFKLSFKNLLSKKGRTILVAIAGSIGIAGVSSVLSVSTGINDYITSMQDDLLSGNPIQISESAYDLSTIMNLLSDSQKAEIAKNLKKGEVNVEDVVKQIIETVGKTSSISVSNTINDDYLRFLEAMPKEYYADMTYKYGYNLQNNVYTSFVKAGETSERYLSLTSILDSYNSVLSSTSDFASSGAYLTSLVDAIKQLPASNSYIETQYNINGHLPTSSDEMLLVLDKNEQISDLMLAELGYYTQDEFVAYAKNSKAMVSDSTVTHDSDKTSFDYDTIYNHKFYFAPNSVVYKNKKSPVTYGQFKFASFEYQDELDLSQSNSNVMELKISGIAIPKDGINYGCLDTGLYYSSALATTLYRNTYSEASNVSVIGQDMQSLLALLQSDDLSFSGLVKLFNYMGSSLPNGEACPAVTYDYDYYDYTDNTVKSAVGYIGESNELSTMMSMMGTSASIEGLDLKTISYRDIGGIITPTTINIFPKSFNDKADVTDYLDLWNQKDYTITLPQTSTSAAKTLTYDERTKVTYTDDVGVIISMIRTLVNIVTYALIAFTALSLVVSCFMIAIITYVSVMERIKEIGVIRSLGGRKKDVSHLFNAETFILGLGSGLIGVIMTYIVTLILNLTLGKLAGANIAAFYGYQALIMILLSVLLTVLSGALPARSAAKQDPVNALRSE